MEVTNRSDHNKHLTNVQAGDWAVRFSNHMSNTFIHQSL